MKLIAVLLGLILATLSHSEDNNCRENIQEKFFYYIYNTSVEIKAYYCSYSIKDELQCENSDNGKIQTNSSHFLKKCKSNFYVQLSNLHKHQNTTAKLCEIPARVNLLEDIVTLSDNKSCSYSGKTCYDGNNSKFVFWSGNYICKNISAIHLNVFTPVNNKYDRTMFIRDTDISLILKEKLQFCDIEVWKTNHDDIIVSAKQISTTEKKAELSKLQSNLQEFCKGKTNNQQSSIDNRNVNDVTKIWYVYKYPIDVTIHICLMNGKKSCEHLNLGETLSKNNLNLLNQCRNNLCDSSPCKSKNSSIVICRTTLQVDLEKNSIIELPSECKYSEGLCKTLNTFWQYTDRCNSIKLAYKGYERMYQRKKCVSPDDNSTRLILSQQGLLCGETVWYTDQNGLVASERELKFTPSKTSLQDETYQNGEYEDKTYKNGMYKDETYKNETDTQSEEINKLQNLLYYSFVVLVVFCSLWYVFNVIVNFSSLRKLNKTRPSSEKVSLLNCLSQSLTAHQLILNHREKELTKVVANVQPPQLYASVNNELYNKPMKLPLKK